MEAERHVRDTGQKVSRFMLAYELDELSWMDLKENNTALKYAPILWAHSIAVPQPAALPSAR